jgi:hypothetical protein
MFKVVIGRTAKAHGGHEVAKEIGVNSWAAFARSDDNAVVEGDSGLATIQGVKTMQSLAPAKEPRSPARWAPPDGLERSLPRQVRLTAQGLGVMGLAIVLGVGALAAFVILQAVGQRKLDEVRLLREQGVLAAATVTRRWRTGGEDPSHWIAYRFPSGEQAERWRAASPDAPGGRCRTREERWRSAMFPAARS